MTYQYITRFLWVKSVSDIIFVTKIVKRLGLYGYCFQKWAHIEETLMKLNGYLA